MAPCQPFCCSQAFFSTEQQVSGNLNSPLPFPLCTTPALHVPLHFEKGSPSSQASALMTLHTTLHITMQMFTAQQGRQLISFDSSWVLILLGKELGGDGEPKAEPSTAEEKSSRQVQASQSTKNPWGSNTPCTIPRDLATHLLPPLTNWESLPHLSEKVPTVCKPEHQATFCPSSQHQGLDTCLRQAMCRLLISNKLYS